MLDPAYRWDSVQNVPSSATTKFQGPIYTATPYSEEIAIFNRGYPYFKISNPQEIRRFNMGEIGAVDFDEPFSDAPTLRDSHAA